MTHDASVESPHLSPSAAHLLGEILYTMDVATRTAEIDLNMSGLEELEEQELDVTSGLLDDLFNCRITSITNGKSEWIHILESSNIDLEAKLLTVTLTEKFALWPGNDTYRKIFEHAISVRP